MIKFIKENIFFCILVAVSALILLLYYFPALRLNFLLIDDGQIIKNSRVINGFITNPNLNEMDTLVDILFERNEGRVRSVYWITQSIITFITGENVHLMHVVRIIILVITVSLMAKLLLELKVGYHWIFISLFAFLFNFQNIENYYRLGPTEAFLGLYFTFIIYVAFRKNNTFRNYLISFVLMILGIFTKESFFLVLLPFIFLVFIKSKFNWNKRYLISMVLTSILFGSIVLLVKDGYGVVGGYSQNYQFTINSVVNNFINYFRQISHYQTPFLYIYLVYLIYFASFNLKNVFKLDNKVDILFVFLTGQVILNLVILLPWQYVLGRYLIIVNISLALIYGLVLTKLTELVKRTNIIKGKDYMLNIIVIVLIPTLFVRNLFEVGNFQNWQNVDSNLTTDLLRTLAENTPEGQIVYTNYKKGDSNIEIFLETQWHLEEFYQRPDIKFEYLSEDQLCSNNQIYILDRSSDRLVQKDKLLKIKNYIGGNSYEYRPIVYGEVLKSFMNGSKSEHWNLVYPFDWRIYIKSKDECIKI